MSEADKAHPTYSRLRNGILKLTPDEYKCRLYCKGAECKYCRVDGCPVEMQALRGLYSTWITDSVLAMARPFEEHFERFDLVGQFVDNGIRTVINLEEAREHAHCGSGLHPTSGFSYNPERLMRCDIYYYNFPLPDFSSCTQEKLADIVKVASYALTQGKIAIHCHAGHGRTGMLVAALLIYQLGIEPSKAVEIVRSKRPKSVQSLPQAVSLNEMRDVMESAGKAIPALKWGNVQEALVYQAEFLAGSEKRVYAHIPKVAYLLCHRMLRLLYENVRFHYGTGAESTQAENGQMATRCKMGFFLSGKIASDFNAQALRPTLLGFVNGKPELNPESQQLMTRQLLTVANFHTYINNLSMEPLLSLLDAFMKRFGALASLTALRAVIERNSPKALRISQLIIVTETWHWMFLQMAHTFAVIYPSSDEAAKLLIFWFTREDDDLRGLDVALRNFMTVLRHNMKIEDKSP